MPAVTVLSGFSPAATHAVARGLLADDQRLILIRHDLTGVRDGIVHRIVRTAGEVLEDERVTLVHGCVSCTLREDVLPTLVRLARAHPDRDQVLMLPEAVEPEAVAAATGWCLIDGAPVTDHVRFASYTTVVDAGRVLDDLTTTDSLRDRALHAADDDHREVADIVARQIEYADTVVMWGFGEMSLPVLLHRLAPWATHVPAAGFRPEARHRPGTPGVLVRGIEGYAVGVHEPVPDCGVVSMLFQARRPFHAGRLNDALNTIVRPTLRGRGHLWLANRPDTAIAWDSAAGGLSMGSLGRWLAALPEERWEEASEGRRLAATVEWDPYYGDRGNQLAFVGMELDAADLHRRLAACLLTDDELAAGEDTWKTWSDPFAGCLRVGENPVRD
ncbi:CobW family GTP-binding protein [Phytohabitans aurantiacus]|uniref:Cobalamin biosynthesis protein CobW n=1 Tax=Phytohabitans aurantiacus TaxID=3016789 RepID=A0ABQ5QS95_9ACTN|nr:GTP-binding protein [Phytohabitans aurantiacus]GLH97269.1 cobalamin biosynthesis protein CobW [Phytohabitans aurantiacus]